MLGGPDVAEGGYLGDVSAASSFPYLTGVAAAEEEMRLVFNGVAEGTSVACRLFLDITHLI